MTGNEHNEFGFVSVDKTNRLRMMSKRMKKIEHAMADLPKGNLFGGRDAKIGIIGFGSTYGPILESMDQLANKGISTRFHQIRTIFPLLEDDLNEFTEPMERVFVVESNYQGQLAAMLRSAIKDKEKLESITKFDGAAFKPKEIAGAIQSVLKGGHVLEA